MLYIIITFDAGASLHSQLLTSRRLNKTLPKGVGSLNSNLYDSRRIGFVFLITM
jgi:hypothetical protein